MAAFRGSTKGAQLQHPEDVDANGLWQLVLGEVGGW